MALEHLLVRGAGELPGFLKKRLGIRGDSDSLPPTDQLLHECRGKSRLLIGPANSAGQAHRWAEAADLVDGWCGRNIDYLKDDAFHFNAHYAAPEQAVVYSPRWARKLRTLLSKEYDAVLYESLLPLMGSLHLQNAAAELAYLRERGVGVGMILHGSDIRVPSVQEQTVGTSVFTSAPKEAAKAFEGQAKRNNAILDELNVQEFVSTPDQLRYRPNATWLPIQVAQEYLRAAEEYEPAAESREVTVLHLPSQGFLKGTQWIGPAMEAVEREGKIRYLAPKRVPHSQMRSLIGEADIVIDAVGMGAYGVMSIEAMALGKVVVAEVGDFVRERVRELTGQEVPIVEATAQTVGDVVEKVAGSADLRRSLGKDGVRYVLDVHSRARAAEALRPFLGEAARTSAG